MLRTNTDVAAPLALLLEILLNIQIDLVNINTGDIRNPVINLLVGLPLLQFVRLNHPIFPTTVLTLLPHMLAACRLSLLVNVLL